MLEKKKRLNQTLWLVYTVALGVMLVGLFAFQMPQVLVAIPVAAALTVVAYRVAGIDMAQEEVLDQIEQGRRKERAVQLHMENERRKELGG